MSHRVLIWVQHLMGIGHVMRAEAISAALTERGVDVCVVFGGASVPSVDFGTARTLQLPPAKAADMPQHGIVDLNGQRLSEDWYETRREMLLGATQEFEPDLIITEQYPFGRRAFEFELKPLLTWARTKSIPIVGSVRDILVKKKKVERNQQMADIVTEFYDSVMVHGDANVIPFGATFPAADQIRDQIFYTGYVARPRDLNTSDGMGEVIVSAGGGRYGERLYRTALQARDMSPLADRTWRVLVGGNAETEMLGLLRESAGDGIIVEPARRDFPAMLKHAALSISQAGYNTTLDVLAAGVRSVMVPYTGDEETEQTLRAGSLEAQGVTVMLDENDLSDRTLCDAIERALAQDPSSARKPSTEGAEVSADFILRRLRSSTH